MKGAKTRATTQKGVRKREVRGNHRKEGNALRRCPFQRLRFFVCVEGEVSFAREEKEEGIGGAERRRR